MRKLLVVLLSLIYCSGYAQSNPAGSNHANGAFLRGRLKLDSMLTGVNDTAAFKPLVIRLSDSVVARSSWPGGVPIGGSTAIQYDSAGSFSGNITNFSWDYTNARMGINMAATTRRLDIFDGANPQLRLVGIIPATFADFHLQTDGILNTNTVGTFPNIYTYGNGTTGMAAFGNHGSAQITIFGSQIAGANEGALFFGQDTRYGGTRCAALFDYLASLGRFGINSNGTAYFGSSNTQYILSVETQPSAVALANLQTTVTNTGYWGLSNTAPLSIFQIGSSTTNPTLIQSYGVRGAFFGSGGNGAKVTDNFSSVGIPQPDMAFNGFGIDSSGGSRAGLHYTNNSTVLIEGAPVSTVNSPADSIVAVDSAWALRVKSGATFIGGTLQIHDGTQAAARVLTSDANGIASWQTVSGAYVPTLTGVSNVSSSSPDSAFWTKSGKIVTVFGSISVTATLGTNTSTAIDISLPIATNLGAHSLWGTGGNPSIVLGQPVIQADVTNDVAMLQFSAPAAGVSVIQYSFRYIVQ